MAWPLCNNISWRELISLVLSYAVIFCSVNTIRRDFEMKSREIESAREMNVTFTTKYQRDTWEGGSSAPLKKNTTRIQTDFNSKCWLAQASREKWEWENIRESQNRRACVRSQQILLDNYYTMLDTDDGMECWRVTRELTRRKHITSIFLRVYYFVFSYPQMEKFSRFFFYSFRAAVASD